MTEWTLTIERYVKKQCRRRNGDVLSLIPSGPGLKITNTPPIFRYIIPQQIYIPISVEFLCYHF